MKRFLFLIPLLLPACGVVEAFLTEPLGRQGGKKTPENSYMKQGGSPVELDLSPGQSSLTSDLVDANEKLKELELLVKKLEQALETTRKDLRRTEMEFTREQNAKVAAEAQLASRDAEHRKALAQILALRLEKSRLQQKVYILQLTERETELTEKMRPPSGGGR